MYDSIYPPDYYILEHHGIKGQKWGVRRYQNPDGSLTSAGEKRYQKLGLNYRRASTFDDVRIGTAKKDVLKTTGGYKTGLFSKGHNKRVDEALTGRMKKVVSSSHKQAHALAKLDDDTGTGVGASRFGTNRIQGGDFSYHRNVNGIVGGVVGGTSGLAAGAALGAAAASGVATVPAVVAMAAVSAGINGAAGVSIGHLYTDKANKYASKRAHYDALIDSYMKSLDRE